MGYTEDTMDFSQNQVTLSHSSYAGTAGSDDASGTLRTKSDNIAVSSLSILNRLFKNDMSLKLYNIDIINEYGEFTTDGQAIALSQYGSSFGAYACRFFSYQVR